MNERESRNVTLLFAVLIFGFAAAALLWPKRSYSEAENRTLAAFPKVSAETVFNGQFESGYEDYLTDQFPLRDIWVGWKTNMERLTGHRDTKDIYFAKDHYLIEKHTGAFTSDMAEANIQAVRMFVENWHARFDGHLTVMVVPNAVKLLQDRLPAFASPYDEGEYLSRLSQVLPEEVWFDVTPALEAHDRDDLFYRTDHHWKTGAAFAAFRSWMERRNRTVPEASDYTIETVTEHFLGTIQSKLGIDAMEDSIQVYRGKNDPAYTVEKTSDGSVSDSLYVESYLQTKDKYAVFFGGNEGLIHIDTDVQNGQRMLVIKDSYANCFVPFLLPEFSKIDLLDVRYYNQKVSDLIAQGNYTDILILYNAAGFAEDAAIARLNL